MSVEQSGAAYRANYKLIDWSNTPEWSPRRRETAFRPFQIIKDIEPYRNVIDGKVIGSRSQHRDFLREHGVIEVGNEKPKPPSRQPLPDARQDARQALEMVRQGYRPRPPETYREE